MSGTSSASSLSSRGRTHGWAPSASRTAHTPNGLIKRYALPIAAYLHTTEVPPGLDTSRPLLLYNNFNSSKVRAISLRACRESGLTPIGPSLVIPDSYTGWFSVVTPDGRSAPYYTTIDKVSEAQLPFFLTRFDIPAYVRVEDEAEPSRLTYQRSVVQSGHVLKLLGIFEDLNARRTKNAPCNKYAQCLNYCNEVLFVPFSAKGRFYAAAHRGTRTTGHVFLMSQLLNAFQLPLTVRLVCGYMPRIPQAFTGILRLEKAQNESVLLACTMTSEAKATLLEMDVNSNFILSPITDPLFPKTPIFLKTVSYCADEADSWRRQIKVTHHVTEEGSGSSSGRSTGNNTFESNGSGSNRGSGSNPISHHLFQDFEKRKGRTRDKSRTRELNMRDKSRDFRIGEKVKESRDKTGRDKSRLRDTRIRDLVKDKIQDMSRNIPYTVSGEFVSIRVDDKLSGKNGENRKVCKQNTYIFQNGRSSKYPDKKKEMKPQPPKSVENCQYSTVIDNISPIKEEDSAQYAEICEHKILSDPRSGVARANSRDKKRPTSLQTDRYSDFRIYTSGSSAEEENQYSFTLMKKDFGKCYGRLTGLGLNGSGRIRLGKSDSSVC